MLSKMLLEGRADGCVGHLCEDRDFFSISVSNLSALLSVCTNEQRGDRHLCLLVFWREKPFVRLFFSASLTPGATAKLSSWGCFSLPFE